MKYLLLFFSLQICLSAYGQSKAQKTIEKDFVNKYCDCLQKYSSQEPDKILYSFTESCIREFFGNNTELINVLVKELEGDTTLSDYEKGRKIGKSIIFNTIGDLVKDCKLYRKTMTEYKELIKAQLNIKDGSVENFIVELKSKESQLTDDKNRATFYTVLGILYEFQGDKKEALNSYDKSLGIYPTTQAKGLKMLLKKE
jgi:tetratricopeptide (TPR) repeat protein